MTYKIEVQLGVHNLTPDKLSSRDVGELISSIENMLEAIIVRDNPTLRLSTNDVILSLIGVHGSSSHFEFATEFDQVVESAYSIATTAIATNKYDVLPYKAVDAIKDIRKFSKKYNVATELWEVNGTRRQMAVVLPATEINVEEAGFIYGHTTLYGFVTGISGESPPRAKIRLLDGKTFDFHVTEKNNLQIARELGRRLYTDVGVRGNARWQLKDELVLDYFLIEELAEFTPVPIEEALNSLNKIVGEDYALVDDIEALINELRGRDEELE